MPILPIPSSSPVTAYRIRPATSHQHTAVPKKTTYTAFDQKEPHQAQVPSEGQNPHVLSINSVDEFFYGYRFVQICKNGTATWEQVPLTLEDLLFPQVDDKVSQNWEHSDLGYLLYAILRNYLEKIPGMQVLWDVIIRWDIPGQRDFVPDILVLMDVQYIPKKRTVIFDRAKYGGIPVLAIELTSKSTRYRDVNTDDSDDNKYTEYEAIGVWYYLVVDLARKSVNKPPAFWGYQLVGKKYQPIIPDPHGRLWINQLGVSLGEHGEQLAWFDADGNRLLSFAEQEERADQEQARADQEQARADQEAQARQAAEERIRELEAALRQRV